MIGASKTYTEGRQAIEDAVSAVRDAARDRSDYDTVARCAMIQSAILAAMPIAPGAVDSDAVLGDASLHQIRMVAIGARDDAQADNDDAGYIMWRRILGGIESAQRRHESPSTVDDVMVRETQEEVVLEVICTLRDEHKALHGEWDETYQLYQRVCLDHASATPGVADGVSETLEWAWEQGIQPLTPSALYDWAYAFLSSDEGKGLLTHCHPSPVGVGTDS